jgi:hypothetical protein
LTEYKLKGRREEGKLGPLKESGFLEEQAVTVFGESRDGLERW